MKRLLILIFVLILIAPAPATTIKVNSRKFTSEPTMRRRTTITLLEAGPVVSGSWLIAGDAVSLFTDTNGVAWYSNVLAGAYRLDIAGSPSRSFPITVFDTNGIVDAQALVNTTNYNTSFYTTPQVDSLIGDLQNQIDSLEVGGLSFVPQLGSANLTNWSTLTTNVLGSIGGSTFTDTYKAWVSAAGSDTTGTVGKEELPFATVSNAVRAVKVALGSSTSRGVVLVGAGVFGEYWVNLQRTNLPGISLIGVSPQATMLTSTGTSYLTNLGPLVVLGHNSAVANLSISNNISAGYKQAAIGWDASRGTTAGTTFVVPTNIFIQNVIGQGSSDVGYFYDSGSSYYSMWLDKVDFESKWDAFFLSTAAFDGQVKITKSSIRVYQPDDYGFPDGGSGNGRARAVYVGEGYLTIADSSVIAIGGANTVNETTALTHFGSTEGYTNMNTALSASSTGSGAVTLEYYSSSPSYIGKLTPGVITTNEPYANSVPLATSYRTAKQINLFTNQNNWSGSNYWSGLTKFAGPVGMANLTATDGATWSLNNLLWSMSSGKMAINGGAINYTNDPNGLTSWYDVNATDYLLYLEPDGVGSGPRVYLYNPFGNGAGFTNIPATAIAGGSQGQVVTWHGAGAIWSNPPAGGGSFTLTMNPNQFAQAGGTTNIKSGATLTNVNQWGNFVLRSEDASNDITVTNHSQKLKINSTANPFTADTEIGEDIKAGTFYGVSNNITGGISAGSIGTTTLTVSGAATVSQGVLYATNILASGYPIDFSKSFFGLATNNTVPVGVATGWINTNWNQCMWGITNTAGSGTPIQISVPAWGQYLPGGGTVPYVTNYAIVLFWSTYGAGTNYMVISR